MSRLRTSIEIESPKIGLEAERVSMGGFVCNECNGTGFILTDKRRSLVNMKCPVCGGSGELHADITVEWRKSDKTKQT